MNLVFLSLIFIVWVIYLLDMFKLQTFFLFVWLQVMFCPERAVKFEVFVGGSSDCKLVVFVFMHVGGTDELQPGGPFLRLSCRWILPTDCRRPPLSLSWSGSPKGNSEWSKSLARTYAVSFSFASSIANALRHKKVRRNGYVIAMSFQWGVCAPQAEKGCSRGGSVPRSLECSWLSQHHSRCAKTKWGNSTPTLLFWECLHSVEKFQTFHAHLCLRSQNGSAPSHKQFRIQQKGSVFCMEGWDREFSSVKEFIDNLKTFVLKSGSDSFTVKKCLLPKQAGLYFTLLLKY